MKKRFSFAFGVLLVLVPLFVFAHGDKYLEFNPDQSSSLKDANVATPTQVFFAQSDFLNGFDFWVANPGSSGTAIFSLINEQGAVLTTKTVAIPTIAITSSGTRFHVDLNSQLSVLASDKYSLRTTTSMPELRLYYSDRVQIISHNAPFVSPYVTGVAVLGSEEQHFSFKYALYETNETSAPIISNIGWAVVSPTQMKVDFNSNEPADYKIEYGPSGQGYTQSTDFSGDYQFCTAGISLCSITVAVSPDTAYQYILTAKDSWGNQSQVAGTFTSGQAQAPSPTPTPTDLPPAVSNLRIAAVTDRSVDVAWTTSEIANSNLLISFSSDLISITAVTDPVFELEHLLKTNPVLSPGTAYLATVRSVDLTNNETKASISFITLPGPTPVPSPSLSPSPPPPPPTTSPAASSPPPLQSSQPTSQPAGQQQGIITSPGSGGTEIIQWNSPSGGEPSDGYRIDIFDKNGNLKRSILVPAGSRNTEVSGLEDGEYSVIVYTNNNGVFEKVDQPAKLKVGEPPLIKRLLGFWWALIPLVAGLGYILWKNFKKKSSQIISQVD